MEPHPSGRVCKKAVPHVADRDCGVGEAITIERGELPATVPAAEFLENNTFHVVGEAGLTQPSQDAGCLRRECIGIGGVDAHRVELSEDLQQLVVELAIARLKGVGRIFRHVASSTRLRSGSNLARPYIWRLITFTLLTWLSTDPELQRLVSPAWTASQSLRRLRPKPRSSGGPSA